MARSVKWWVGSTLVVVMCSTLRGEEPPNLVPNPSFEEGSGSKPASWQISDSMSRWVNDHAAAGTHSLLIEDTSAKDGSNVASAHIAVDGGETYTVRTKSYALSGNGLGLYLRCYDAAGTYIRVADALAQRTLSSRKRRWKSSAFTLTLPDTCTHVQVWLHSYSGSVVSAYVDDLELRKGVHVKPSDDSAAPRPVQAAAVNFSAGPHPFLLVTPDDLSRMSAMARSQEWARNALSNFLETAKRRNAAAIVHPDRGGGWYHWYACPKDGGQLQTVSATEHRCSRCGKVYTGDPYDAVPIMSQHNDLAARCRDLGLAYALTGDAEFAKTVRTILLGYADRYATYELHDTRGPSKRASAGRVGPQTLDESCWLIPVAQGYDLIYESDLLSTADRRHIEVDLLRAAAAIIRRHDAGKSNWQSWHNAGMGAVAFCLRDRELAEHVVNGRSGFQAQMVNSVTDEGFWYEGAWGYHYYALSAHLALTEMAFRSGTDLYGNPRYRGLYDIPMRFMAPNRQLPAFHDSGLSSGLPGTPYLEVAFRHWQDPNVAWGIHQRGRGWDALLRGLPDVPDVAAPDLHSVNFAGPGFAILRNGTGIDDMYLALDYGPHGGGHGHPDKLGFSFYALGDYVAHDPGCVAYGVPIHSQWYRQTVSHNTIVIDGQSQEQCTGELNCFFAAPGFQVVAASTELAYDPVRLARTAVMTAGYVLLVDDVSDMEKHIIDWALHGVGELASGLDLAPRADPPGKDAGYEHIDKVRSATDDGPWSAAWVRPLQSFQVVMAGVPETEVITGRGWSLSGLGKQPMILVRREAETTRYVSVLEPFRGAAPKTTVEEISPDQPLAGACGVRIIGAACDDLFLRGAAGSTFTAGPAATDGCFAFVSGVDGDVCLAFIDGTSVARGAGIAQSVSQSRLVVRREGPGLWTVQHTGPPGNTVSFGAPSWQRDWQAMGRPNVVTIDASGKRGGAVEASLDAATCSFAAAPAASYEIAFPGSLTLAEHRERELTAAVAAAKLARRPPIPEYPVRAFTSPEGGGKTAGERIIVQAEDFSAQGLGEVRKTDQKVATQNEAFLNWNNPGHWLEWPVKVAQAGVYTITFRYCTQDEGAKRAIVIDEAYPAECCLDVPFPSTGGYSNKHDDWCSLVISDPVTGQAVTAYLDPGIHTLRAYNVSSPVNLDYIVLEPVEND